MPEGSRPLHYRGERVVKTRSQHYILGRRIKLRVGKRNPPWEDGGKSLEEVPERFVALEVHKNYVLAAAGDGRQELVLKPRRVRMEDLGRWAVENLHAPASHPVLEAEGSFSC